MKHDLSPFKRLLLTGLILGLLSPGLVGCGGGGGGNDQPQVQASGQQGMRFAIDAQFAQMVHSVDATGPNGKQKYTLGLSPGQEMYIAMPPGTYQLDFWVYAGGGFSVRDMTPRTATVQPSQVTRVEYP